MTGNDAQARVDAIATAAFMQMVGDVQVSDALKAEAEHFNRSAIERAVTQDPATELAARRSTRALRRMMAQGRDPQMAAIKVDLYTKLITDAANGTTADVPMPMVACGKASGVTLSPMIVRDAAPLNPAQRDLMLQFLAPSSITGEDFGNVPLIKQIYKVPLDMAWASHDFLKQLRGETPEALQTLREQGLRTWYPGVDQDTLWAVIAIHRLEIASEGMLHAMQMHDSSERNADASDISRHQFKIAKKAMIEVLHDIGSWDEATSSKRIDDFCEQIQIAARLRLTYEPSSVAR